MPEGSERFIPLAKQERKFFPKTGKLTKEEQVLSRFLSANIERSRISLSDFGVIDLASIGKIAEDRTKIKSAKENQKRIDDEIKTSDPENYFLKERGVLAEQSIIYGMQTGEWFGGGAEVRVASEYDDLFNGVDCIVELDSTKQLAIGIDTTLSENKVPEKLKRIKQGILKGKLAEVRYFKNANLTGSLHNVPLTIVGVGINANSSLAGLIYGAEMADQSHSENKSAKRETPQQEIKKHIIRFIILIEIKIQLKAFLNYARSIGAKEYIIKKLSDDLAKINEVLNEQVPKDKAERQKLIAEVEQDEVFRKIKQELAKQFWVAEETEAEPQIFRAKIK